MNAYMAIDQYDQTYHIGRNPPRKWLLNHLGRNHCSKIYRDTDEGVRHVGYVIAGLWLELFTVTPMRRK